MLMSPNFKDMPIRGRRNVHSEPESPKLDKTALPDTCSSEDDSDDETRSVDTEYSDNFESTQNISNTFETSRKKLHGSLNERSNYIKHTECYDKKSSESHFGRYTKSLIVVIAVIGLSMYFFVILKAQQPTNKSCSFNELRQKYPTQQEKIWRRLEVGIENILNKRVESPAVYLFVHKVQGIEEIITEIAKRFSFCFGDDMKPVEIESKDFTSQEAEFDYGYAIEKYKSKIKEGKVILIANLNEIPAGAARALHTICDTISPIANEVIIILKLAVPDLEGHAVQSARNTLENLWGSKLKNNELDALITRVTEDVIALRS
ncbi:torsin-1A-interacting protein 1 [Teleopsis dalmanni]|uniref:torsin-1A-interacting protein 1 n=1 Tax=Teleopsis dalmanni TaxID=139649 RepID=UPI0018CD9AE0|nr:torsin-1A-interacting protein 1 [Teleopsis dalmanni]